MNIKPVFVIHDENPQKTAIAFQNALSLSFQRTAQQGGTKNKEESTTNNISIACNLDKYAL